MPSVSEKQRRFMGAEYGRAKRGESTRTGMSKDRLGEWVASDARKRGRRDAMRRMARGGK